MASHSSICFQMQQQQKTKSRWKFLCMLLLIFGIDNSLPIRNSNFQLQISLLLPVKHLPGGLPEQIF